MKSKTRFTRTKKLIAWLLVICMVMTNSSPITSIHVHAEGEGSSSTTTIACTMNATVNVGGYDITIPENYITIKDSSGTEVVCTNANYNLVPGASYTCVIKGNEMEEHSVVFTAPETEGAISISGDASKIKLVYDDVEEFFVGESKTPVSDLGITWTWSTSSASIASLIEEGEEPNKQVKGKIKGEGAGTVTIKRTSAVKPANGSTTYSAIVNEATLTVKGKKDFDVTFKINGTDSAFTFDKKNVVIKDTNNNTVACNDSGKYTFVCGDTYTYKLVSGAGLKGVSVPGNGSFTVPNSGTEVTLPLELTTPVMSLENNDLTASLPIKKMKNTESAIINCINVDQLYNSDKWKIQINSGNKKDINSDDISINTQNSVTIKYYYDGIDVGKNLVLNNFFDNYSIAYRYGNIAINDSSISNETFSGNTERANLLGNKEYELTNISIKGLTYNTSEKQKITTKYTQQNYEIDLAKSVTVTKPTISVNGNQYTANNDGVYEILYGEEITVKVDNMNALLNNGTTGWSWKWDSKLESENQTVNASQQYQFSLKGTPDQTYTLTYVLNDNQTVSNSLKFKVKKIELNINANEMLPAISKPYDATNQFVFDMKINDTMSNGTGYFKDQKGNSISQDEKITLKGEVSGTAPGQYARIKITDVDAKKDYIDASALIGKGYNINKAVIEIAETKFKLSKLNRFYMDNNWDIAHIEIQENNSPGIYKNSNIESPLKEELFNAMTIEITDEINCKYNIKNSETDTDYQITTDHVKAKVSCDHTYETVPQILDSERHMEQYINLYQAQRGEKVQLGNSGDENMTKWVNKGDIIAELNDNKTPDQKNYKDYYNTIQFKKTSYNNNIVQINTVNNLTDNLTFDNVDTSKDLYYSVILSKDGEYKTTALIIRIIAENNANKEYDDTIEGSDGTTYRVVNLIMDDTKDTISLSFDKNGNEAIKGITNQNSDGLNKGDYEKNEDGTDIIYNKPCGTNLYLNIKNTSTDIVERYYKIIDDKDNIVDSNIVESSNVIPLDVVDGRYIVLVKVVDGVGNTSLFATNPIVLDNTRPEINATLGGTALDSADQSMIVNQSQELVITVKETNIKNVTATVKAVNAEGNNVEKIELSKDNMENALKNGTSPYTYKCNVTTDANYTVKLTVTDQVGNETSVTYHFTKDATAPNEGKIEIAGFMSEITSKDGGVIKTAAKNIAQVWNGIVEKIYDIFLQGSAEVTMSAKDETTGFEISYIMEDHVYSEEELRALPEDNWTQYDEANKPKTQADQREFIYMRAKDKAGNASYFNSKGIITDTVAPEISYTLDREANKNGFYNNDVTIQAEVKDSTGSLQNGSSGLQYVGYRIEADGKKLKAEALIDAVTAETSKNFKIVLDAKTYNTNDLKVYITAVDNAGNKKDFEAEPIELKIDNVAPQISVTFDDQDGAEYYNHTRTATVTIKERNLKTSDIDLQITSKHGKKATIGKWSHTDNIEKSDDATYTCKVKFDQDDDYTFYVDCVDKAGNKAKTSKKYKFTIDKTVPTIEVSYNNAQVTENSYFNQEITATITIKEHNFDANQATVQVGAQNAAAPSTTAFNGQGDTHTANVTFSKDGVYQLQVAFKDKAGNEADSYRGSTFTIDLTNPEIQITNVEDKSANKDEVNPVIVCKDENYDNKNVTITVTGANSGEVELNQLGLSRRATGDGEEFSLNFPEQEDMDDVYTLTAKMEDMAGNGAEQTVQFSVNRYGSVYTLGTESGEWLENGVCVYVKEAKPVVIIETNVDEVVEHNISYTTGAISAEAVAVKDQADCTGDEQTKGTYYETKDVSAGNNWYQYQYTIESGNFSKEGNYSIQIDSTDRAGNHTSNVSNKHKDSNLEILFAVDRTAPSAVVTGTENGGIYKEDEHTVLLDVQDNIALKDVTIYLNGNQYATYDANQIAELEDGLIPVNVTESISTQTIQLVATDMAGNILGEKPEGEFDKTFEDFNLLVTQNVLVQILHAYWVVMILGAVAIGAGTTGVLLIRRRKK